MRSSESPEGSGAGREVGPGRGWQVGPGLGAGEVWGQVR